MKLSKALKKISDEAFRSAKDLDIKLAKVESFTGGSSEIGTIEIRLKKGPLLDITYFNVENEVHFSVKKGEPLYQFAILMGDNLEFDSDFIPSYSI